MRIFTPAEKLIALKWWRSLSINEMKSFERKYKSIYDMASVSEIAAIHEAESAKPRPKQVRLTLELSREAAKNIIDDPKAFIDFLKKNNINATAIRPSFEPETDPSFAWT